MSNSFLGRGWKFPIQVDATTGRIVLSEGEEDIEESIRIILWTSRGERVMRADFGCDVQKFLFESTGETKLRMLEANIAEAIRKWEPRVDQVEVRTTVNRRDPGKLDVNIQYVVRSTNNLFNLVFPFYIQEGTR